LHACKQAHFVHYSYSILKGLLVITMLMIVMVNLANCTTYNVTPDDDCCPNGTLCRDDATTWSITCLATTSTLLTMFKCIFFMGYTIPSYNLSTESCCIFSLIGTARWFSWYTMRKTAYYTGKWHQTNLLETCPSEIVAPGVTVLPYILFTWITIEML